MRKIFLRYKISIALNGNCIWLWNKKWVKESCAILYWLKFDILCYSICLFLSNCRVEKGRFIEERGAHISCSSHAFVTRASSNLSSCSHFWFAVCSIFSNFVEIPTGPSCLERGESASTLLPRGIWRRNCLMRAKNFIADAHFGMQLNFCRRWQVLMP